MHDQRFISMRSQMDLYTNYWAMCIPLDACTAMVLFVPCSIQPIDIQITQTWHPGGVLGRSFLFAEAGS